jgi:hypothetical protein
MAYPEDEIASGQVTDIAKSLASMVIEWVEGGLRLNTDWRTGLADVIQARLTRLMRAKNREGDK